MRRASDTTTGKQAPMPQGLDQGLKRCNIRVDPECFSPDFTIHSKGNLKRVFPTVTVCSAVLSSLSLSLLVALARLSSCAVEEGEKAA